MVTPDSMASLAHWSGMVFMLLGLLYCGWYLATLPCNPWHAGGQGHRPFGDQIDDYREQRDG